MLFVVGCGLGSVHADAGAGRAELHPVRGHGRRHGGGDLLPDPRRRGRRGRARAPSCRTGKDDRRPLRPPLRPDGGPSRPSPTAWTTAFLYAVPVAVLAFLLSFLLREVGCARRRGRGGAGRRRRRRGREPARAGGGRWRGRPGRRRATAAGPARGAADRSIVGQPSEPPGSTPAAGRPGDRGPPSAFARPPPSRPPLLGRALPPSPARAARYRSGAAAPDPGRPARPPPPGPRPKPVPPPSTACGCDRRRCATPEGNGPYAAASAASGRPARTTRSSRSRPVSTPSPVVARSRKIRCPDCSPPSDQPWSSRASNTYRSPTCVWCTRTPASAIAR